MTRRGPRALTPEERRLWEEVARLITPLRGRAPLPAPAVAPMLIPASARPAPPSPAPKLTPKPAPAPRLPPVVPVPRAVPPPAPPVLERRLRVALRRGSTGVDAVLDLHGMRQAEAHAALHGFLRRSGSAGHRLVLVVTGKGPEQGGPWEADAFSSERGVLRRSVPRWLTLPEMRRLVVGVEEAGRRHGGEGALYVRLRRADRND